MPEAVLGLGGNLGARRTLFRAAEKLLGDRPGLRVLARSRLYDTPPLGPPQPHYLNAALRVAFDGEVEALLAETQEVERLLGRERRERWGARTLDIDVLHWSGGAVRSPQLEVPHPELGKRDFALAPLLDVAPELARSWGPVLEQLGGAPKVDERGFLALQAAEEGWVSAFLTDDAELIVLALELGGSTTALPACRARPFSVAASLASEADMDVLRALLDDVARAGFAVRGAAITRVGEHEVEGLLLGAEAPPDVGVNARALVLESDAHGARRVRGRAAWSEDGLITSGSGTM